MLGSMIHREKSFHLWDCLIVYGCVHKHECVGAAEAELLQSDHLPDSIKQDQSDLDLSLHDYKSHIVTPDPGR